MSTAAVRPEPVEGLITQHLDLWTAAIKRRSTAGRGSSSKVELYGIKKLRELILELAVRGLLVPQDPQDEPASELLKKIAAEKAKLVKDGKIRKDKLLPAINDGDHPFDLPQGWVWARLGGIGTVASSSRVHQKDWQALGVPFYRTREIVLLSQHGFVDNELFISEELYKSFEKNGIVPEAGDLMFTGVGTIGVPYVVADSDKFYFKDASVLIFKNHFRIYPRFLSCFMRSPCWINAIHEDSMGTTVHTLTIVRANNVPVPLPPLAEQHRIVAKVDELMALCDQLEQQTDASLSAHQTLVETLLNALTSAADHAQFASSWQRIAEHFDTLFTTEESIDQLKQTILQLAVMGKLVPQDHKDEPASELLKKIAAEKAKLVKEGKIKKEKPLPSIAEIESPFALPAGWAWARFQSISSKITDGDHKTPPRTESGMRMLSAKNVRDGFLDFGNCDFISEDDYIKSRERCLPEQGDLLIVSVGGTIGRSSLVPRDSNFSLVRSVALIKPIIFDSKFLKFLADSPLLQSFIHGNKRGGAQPCLYLSEIVKFPIPVAPLSEQQRIVAKVDELMTFCDQLKSRLSAAEQLRLKLAEAVADAALNSPSGKVIPFPDAAAREARRHATGCHAVAALKDQRSFGRTMLMKLIYLADTHVGAGLAMEVERYAAGPFDQWIYRFEEHAEAAGWFGHEKTQGEKIRYKPQAGLAAQAAKVHDLLDATQVAELDRVLKLFAGLSTEDAEIIATLFAAWNDFLIEGHTPGDAEVIREVRENWTPEKQRFSADKLQTWLDWMRKNKLVPRGLGPRTVQQGQLFH
ncbi:MAG: restriction endonuclease subunit S [Moraxellaceae bacterium]|nr:restriction endonuclease subunit S [Moraxellaceae bacterium]